MTVGALAEQFVPVYDVSDEVAVLVDPESSVVWDALMEADLIELGRRAPLVGALGAVRMLPELVAYLLHGGRPPSAPESMRLRDTAAIPRAEVRQDAETRAG